MRAIIAIALAFGSGLLVQYGIDATLVRSQLHGKHWNLTKNVYDEAIFRQQAISFLRKE